MTRQKKCHVLVTKFLKSSGGKNLQKCFSITWRVEKKIIFLYLNTVNSFKSEGIQTIFCWILETISNFHLLYIMWDIEYLEATRSVTGKFLCGTVERTVCKWDKTVRLKSHIKTDISKKPAKCCFHHVMWDVFSPPTLQAQVEITEWFRWEKAL